MDKFSLEKRLKNNIFFKGEQLHIGKYEKENISILENMSKNEIKTNVLITPNKEQTQILSLIVFGIYVYMNNLTDKHKNILDYLDIGDVVTYKGNKLKYIGIEENYGEKKIKLNQRGNKINGIRMKDSISYIRLSDWYKLSIYNGNSKKTSTMTNNRSKKKSGKFILADMLDMSLDELGGIVKSQMIIVYPNKNELGDLVNNIIIKVKGEKYNFTEIFPCKYYSSINNSTDFKGNKLKLKEIFAFTSNLSVAAELIQENQENSKLLLLGEDTYDKELGGLLDSLLYMGKLKKIYIINTFDKFTNLQQLIEKGFQIKVNAWTKTVICKYLNKAQLEKACLNNKNIHVFLKRKIENKVIEESVDISRNLLILKVKLGLLKDEFYCNGIKCFRNISYALLKIFEKTIVPIKRYDEFIIKNKLNKYTVNQLIEILVCILDQNKFYEDNYKVLKSIVEIIKQLDDLLHYTNPKLKCIENLNLGDGDLIVCSNFAEQSILAEYEFIQNKSIIIENIKKYKGHGSFRKIIFTGVYNIRNINQIYCYNALNVVNLLYPSEITKYNEKVSKFNGFFKLIEENNNLGNGNNVEKLQKIKVEYQKFIEDDILENAEKTEREIEGNIQFDIKNYNSKDYLESCLYDLDLEELLSISMEQSGCSIYLEDENRYVKKRIKFKDGKYALLTEFYRSKCLDNEKNNIVIKGINALQIDDKLIFKYYKTEDEIMGLFYKIIASDKFKDKYHKHYYNMKYWKNVLKKYIDSYFQDYSLVVTELLLYGVNRTEQAIKSWVLYENVIGPTEKEVYKALAEITNDKYFLENWKQIYESCTLIRKLSKRLRDNFNYMIIRSVANEKIDGEFEKLVYDVLGDLKKYAQIEEIEKILDISIGVPVNKTNCILEGDIVHKLFE